MPEGTQPLAIYAEDAAGNPAVSPAGPVVRIDNTPPGAVAPHLVGAEGWRSTNGFTLGWSNVAEDDRAPVTAAHIELCRVSGGADCITGTRPSGTSVDDLRVPEAGEWNVRVWTEDQAGNHEPANASAPVRLKFDDKPPALSFECAVAGDPTAVGVAINDPVSGLGSGAIEINGPSTEGGWKLLETSVGGSRLVARVKDEGLSPGTYMLRASARDRAGNLNSTDRNCEGQAMTVSVPLRAAMTVRAGFAGTRKVRKLIGRRGHRRKVWRAVPILRERRVLGYQSRARIGGTLTNHDGQPLGGAGITVLSQSVGSTTWEPLHSLPTDADGRFVYHVTATASHTLRFAYGGSPLALPAYADVVLDTRGDLQSQCHQAAHR